MENCWPVDSILTWEACNLSSILNMECRMPSRPRFAIKSLRTKTAAIFLWNEYFLFTDRLSLNCWRWDLPALALISLTLSLRVSYARLRADMIMVMCSIKNNDWMISHFQKRILISACEPWGGGPRVVVSTAAFHARVRGSVPGLGGLKETKMFLPHPRVKVSIVGSLRGREVACSASDRQGSNSNPVSGGQCHLNHLTILRRFSWPSLAYMCTKVA